MTKEQIAKLLRSGYQLVLKGYGGLEYQYRSDQGVQYEYGYHSKEWREVKHQNIEGVVECIHHLDPRPTQDGR